MKFQHLKEENLSYKRHCGVACTLGGLLCCGAIKTWIHAVWPDCFTKGTTDTIKRAQEIIDERNQKEEEY